MAPALHRAEGRRYESPSGASVAQFLMVHQAHRLRFALFHQSAVSLDLALEKVTIPTIIINSHARDAPVTSLTLGKLKETHCDSVASRFVYVGVTLP